MRCSFCDRSPTTLRDLVTRGAAGICVSCVADFAGYLAAPATAPVHERARHGDRPCLFCRRRHLSSALRFQRGGGVVCAPCIASATRLLERPRSVGVRDVPRGLAAELRRARRAFVRLYPELRLVFLKPRRRGRDRAP